MPITLITGGARSGKSSFAESLSSGFRAKAYIATAVATDNEMRERIERHKRAREGKGFTTFETYKGAGDVLRNERFDVYLLDCVGTAVTNIIFDCVDNPESMGLEDFANAELRAAAWARDVLSAARECGRNLIAVTNEVGMSVVPVYPLARFFRDALGRVNMLLASGADEVYLMAAGIPVKIKG